MKKGTNNKKIKAKGGVEMKITKGTWLLVLACLGFVFFAGSLQAAEEEQAVAQELISGLDIPADVAGTLASGPGVTFGQRLNQALKNGGITQQQYDAIYNRFLQLPDERRGAIKNAFDQGQGIPIGKILNKPEDKASIKEHIADLKAQGFTGEQIANRLRNEGVSAQHLKDLGYGPVGEEQAVAQELISGLDIPADVASTLASGQGTFGERLEGAYNNGAISKEQYGAIVNRFLALPDEKRWAIKGKWDQGGGLNVDQLHNIVNPQDPVSVRDHIKDLMEKGVSPDKIKERLAAQGIDPATYSDIIGAGPSQRDHAKDLMQLGVPPDKIKDILDNQSGDTVRERAHQLRQDGLTKDQIVERLKNEGVSPDHIKDLGLGPEGEPSRPGHAKDIRDMDTPEAQHKVDRAHEKKRDIKGDDTSRVDRIKDSRPGERARQIGKDKLDDRKDRAKQNKIDRAKDAGWGRGGNVGVGAGRAAERKRGR